MIKLPSLTVLRVATLVALAASAALLSDYVAGTPSFCSAVSGCGAVRASGIGNVSVGGFFVPLPAFGVAGFTLQLAASLRSWRATRLVAAIGGAVGLCLLLLQALVIRRFCWLCVTTDLSAVVAALCAAAGTAGEPRPLRGWAWAGLGALALAAPLLWPLIKPSPPVPASVLALYRAGKVNVVEFADFQCPACRRFSGILKAALEPYGDRVHFVRLNKPLSAHEFAAGAARAAICAEAQQKGEPMAEALFTTQDLSAEGIGRLVQSLGLDARVFEACVGDPATTARVERESSLLTPPEFEGLPTTYIGGKRLLGVQSLETVNDALERAARGEGSRGISAYVYLSALVLLVLGVVRVGGSRPVT